MQSPVGIRYTRDYLLIPEYRTNRQRILGSLVYLVDMKSFFSSRDVEVGVVLATYQDLRMRSRGIGHPRRGITARVDLTAKTRQPGSLLMSVPLNIVCFLRQPTRFGKYARRTAAMASVDEIFKVSSGLAHYFLPFMIIQAALTTRRIQVCRARESSILSKIQVRRPATDSCPRCIQLIGTLLIDEVYKSAKTTSNGASRHTPAADDDEMEAGPSLPPDETDQDFGPEAPADDNDDEEGRFFGGGVSKQEYQILDYVEGADTGKAEEKIDAGWLRKTALNFEKRISKNAEMRAKYETEPQKFIGSEADLDADIKALSVLSEHPELFKEFVRLGCADSLVGLLAHENTDIAIDAIEIIGELIDEDVTAEDDQWNALVDAFIDADLLGLIVSNLSRLDENDESDRSGVYHALGIVESLCSRAPVAIQVGGNRELLDWLLSRIQKTEPTVSQNKQYSAEILAILSQVSQENRRGLIELDVVDRMLQLIASYRRRDPEKGGEEEEYMENLFEALTCLVDEVEGKSKFVEAEGVELCLLMLKEGKMSKAPAVRLLDHASAGMLAGQVCQRIVEAGGLKATFTLFSKTHDRRLLSHLVAIFASMLRLLPAASAERIRTLAKFVEKDYEKVVKLMALHRDYSTQVKRVEQENAAEQREASEAEAEELQVELLSRRLDAGLFTLQTIDVIFAWLSAEDGGARRKIKQLLAERDETIASIHATLSEQRDGLDVSEEDGQDMREMLGTLLDFLK